MMLTATAVVVLVAETVEDHIVEGMVHPSLVDTMGATSATATAETMTMAARTKTAAAQALYKLAGERMLHPRLD